MAVVEENYGIAHRYFQAKAGLLGLTRTLALEGARHWVTTRLHACGDVVWHGTRPRPIVTNGWHLLFGPAREPEEIRVR